jgi:peptidoglycan/xylan/chitin deacetylase (PgdA/CDA1 family)
MGETPDEAIISLRMRFEDIQVRRIERERQRRKRTARRAGAVAALAAVAAIVVAVAVSPSGGKAGSAGRGQARASASNKTGPGANSTSHGAVGAATPGSRSTAAGTGVPGHATVPILMYHVINPPPAGAPYPGLYVPAGEFAAQMRALKAAGWHAVTMDQLEANWTRGVPLGPGKPIVLSFDNGYTSQYTNALPVLRQLGWVGVENIQLLGLPPSEGGLTDQQVRGLIAAGWELDTQGMTHADLISLDASGLQYEIAHARQMLRSRYGVPVNWFCYPSGHYDSTVIGAVRAAGFVGSTTVVPGWASRADDPYRLPRLRVLGGTSPSALLAQIAGAESASEPPSSYGTA